MDHVVIEHQIRDEIDVKLQAMRNVSRCYIKKDRLPTKENIEGFTRQIVTFFHVVHDTFALIEVRFDVALDVVDVGELVEEDLRIGIDQLIETGQVSRLQQFVQLLVQRFVHFDRLRVDQSSFLMLQDRIRIVLRLIEENIVQMFDVIFSKVQSFVQRHTGKEIDAIVGVVLNDIFQRVVDKIIVDDRIRIVVR